MTRYSTRGSRGAASVQVLVILVPVLFGLMGFAIDLGQLYLVRGELQAAANAMALGAAAKLIGTEAATEAATSYARLTLNNESGLGNKYYFGGYQIGESTGLLTSEAPAPAYFGAVASAIDTAEGGGEVAGSQARHVRVTLVADTPLTFWSFLSIATDRRVPVRAAAVAGVSAPLCVACGIEPIALAPVDAGDTVDFGFIPGTVYTLGFLCNGTPTPQPLPGSSGRIPYLILNRYNESASSFADEQSQLYRVGADGLPGSTNPAAACFTINNPEQMWATAAPGQCSASNPPTSVVSLVCGLTSRFEPTYPAICGGIADVDTLSTIFAQDPDITEITDYTQYIGNSRRIITVAIVDALNPGGEMIVLGFRQFLLQPVQGGVNVNPADANGRFSALYIGSVMPLKQGRFNGCQQTSGPGKVVLHQ